MSNNMVTKANFDISNMEQLISFAEKISKSTMIPKDYVGRPDNIIVAIMMGWEVGLKPFQAMQNIAVINGRPSIWGDSILAIIKSHPDFEFIKEWEKDGTAYCTIKRKNQPEVTELFSMEDAKRAGLDKKQGPWTQYPRRMLKYRARAFCARDTFADALKGIQVSEESMDLPEIKEVTPKKETATKIENLALGNNSTPDTDNQPEKEEDNGELSIVRTMIKNALTEEALLAAKPYAEMLSDDDKKEARKAYKEKSKELKQKMQSTEGQESATMNETWVEDYDKEGK